MSNLETVIYYHILIIIQYYAKECKGRSAPATFRTCTGSKCLPLILSIPVISLMSNFLELWPTVQAPLPRARRCTRYITLHHVTTLPRWTVERLFFQALILSILYSFHFIPFPQCDPGPFWEVKYGKMMFLIFFKFWGSLLVSLLVLFDQVRMHRIVKQYLMLRQELVLATYPLVISHDYWDGKSVIELNFQILPFCIANCEMTRGCITMFTG